MIRQADSEDVDSIAKICLDSFYGGDDSQFSDAIQQIKKDVNNKQIYVWDAENIQGYIHMRGHHNIHQVAVDKKEKLQGIARKLIGFCEGMAQAHEHTEITAHSHEGLHDFYQKMGFQRDKSIPYLFSKQL